MYYIPPRSPSMYLFDFLQISEPLVSAFSSARQGLYSVHMPLLVPLFYHSRNAILKNHSNQPLPLFPSLQTVSEFFGHSLLLYCSVSFNVKTA